MKTWKIVGGIVLVALIAVGAVVWVATSVPVIEVPKLKMPSPNAFDFFVRAGAQLKDVPTTGDWLDLPLDKREKALRDNQQALATLRQGLPYDYLHPLKYGIDALYPEYRQFRNLARLLRLDARARSDRGDWSGAMNDYLDGMLMGEGIPRDGQLTAKLVGMAVQRICRRDAWAALDHLDSLQARGAIARLEDVARHHLPIDESLEEVKTNELLGLQYEFSGRCKDPSVKDWPELPRYIRSKVFRDYAAYMDECIRNVRLPYAAKPQFPELKQSENKAVAYAYLPADVILSLMCMGCDSVWFGDVRCQAENRLLMTALALRAYKLDRGDYPHKLADLAPSYLHSLPNDPFAMKGSFGYRREGSKYVLWSVGPDAKNDNARPICDSTASADYRYHVSKDSKGDIVAGVSDL